MTKKCLLIFSSVLVIYLNLYILGHYITPAQAGSSNLEDKELVFMIKIKKCLMNYN